MNLENYATTTFDGAFDHKPSVDAILASTVAGRQFQRGVADDRRD